MLKDFPQVDFEDHELFLTALVVLQLDLDLPDIPCPWGWQHRVYFDRTSNVFRIPDFPKRGTWYVITALPEPDRKVVHTSTWHESMQYAKDFTTRTFAYKVYEAPTLF